MSTRILLILALIALVLPSEANDQLRLRVDIKRKIARRHPHFGEGWQQGLTIDGRQGAVLTFDLGREYIFDTSAVPCEHGQFQISRTELPDPTANEPVTNGGCGPDSFVSFTPTNGDVGADVFYGLSRRSLAGSRIKIVAETFCNKYSRIQGISNYDFMGNVCDATFANLARSGPGMIEFFVGIKGPVNYFEDPSELAALRSRLLAYFGNAYGCTEQGYPSYKGPDMSKLHARLDIGKAQFDGFVDALIKAMEMNAVEPEDVAASNRWLQTFFDGSPHGVCNSNDCRTSICDRITDSWGKGSNTQLMRVVVEKALQSAGQPGSMLHDAVQECTAVDNCRQVRDSLVSFYGQHDIFSCTDADFHAVVEPRLGKLRGPDQHSQLLSTTSPVQAEIFHSHVIHHMQQVAAEAGVAFPHKHAQLVAELSRTRPAEEQVFASHPVPHLSAGDLNAVAATPLTIDLSSTEPVTLQVGTQYLVSSAGPCEHPLYLLNTLHNEPITLGVASHDLSLVCENRSTLLLDTLPEHASQPLSFGTLSPTGFQARTPVQIETAQPAHTDL